MRQLDAIEAGVIRDVGKRKQGHGYSRADVLGVDTARVSAAVERLYRDGFLEAAFVEGGLGPSEDLWQPSELTRLGRQWIEEH